MKTRTFKLYLRLLSLTSDWFVEILLRVLDFDMASNRTPEIISFLSEKMGNKAPDELARAFAAIHFF